MQPQSSTLRIIGGRWRSRKIKFTPLKGIRPTTDSNRETLFNWLAPSIVGANCLDLFAGSGALGFEALSRGAKHLTMVDASKKVIHQLRSNAELLEADNLEIICANIPKQLSKIPPEPFDILFLDPPFYHDLIKPTCEKLKNGEYLAKNGLIYIEAEKRLDIEKIIPKTWHILHKKSYGTARAYLLQAD